MFPVSFKNINDYTGIKYLKVVFDSKYFNTEVFVLLRIDFEDSYVKNLIDRFLIKNNQHLALSKSFNVKSELALSSFTNLIFEWLEIRCFKGMTTDTLPYYAAKYYRYWVIDSFSKYEKNSPFAVVEVSFQGLTKFFNSKEFYDDGGQFSKNSLMINIFHFSKNTPIKELDDAFTA